MAVCVNSEGSIYIADLYNDVVREVSIFAERSDISEEIVRLRSHLQQFDSIMHFDETHPLTALEAVSELEPAELPETYPSGM